MLLIAEVPVHPGSPLDGLPGRTINAPRQAQLIAIHRHATGNLELPASRDHLIADGDRLVVLATRAGLGRILTHSVPSSA